jgi:electron transport complex protein RnfB
MIEILLATLIVGFLGVFFGVILALANKYLEVVEDPRIAEVSTLLPNYNCGACGTAGCKDFAAQIVEGKITTLNLCKPGNKVKNYQPIETYLNSHPNKDGSIINVTY